MSSHRVTMFYDGGCPLCRREVEHYRRLDRQGRIDWIDIDRHRGTLNSAGIEYARAMSRLHVRDRQGRIHEGVAAFLILWRQLPGYRWLARTVRLLRLEGILERGYEVFARSRYRRRCAGGACASSR